MPSGNGSIISTAQYAKVVSIKKNTSPGWMPTAIKYKVDSKKKEKKMGWFKRKFAQWSREAWEQARKNEEMVPSKHEGVSGKTSIRFTVYAASGGFIIEHYKQDRYRESDGPELTIVNTGESLGTAVEHILTMESLKA